jgi:hypothetical protein
LTLFDFLFNNVLVHTSVKNDDYFKVSQAFKNEGLKYKIKSSSRNSSTPGPNFYATGLRAPVIYDFYVKKEDEYKAQKILSTLRK